MSADEYAPPRLSLDEAHGIVAEGRRFTVENFGWSKDRTYVGHTDANTYDAAVDRLVSGVAELVGENERLRGRLTRAVQCCERPDGVCLDKADLWDE